MRKQGLYEQVISKQLEAELSEDPRHKEIVPIPKEDSPRILSQYLAGIVKQKLYSLQDTKNGFARQLELINRLAAEIERIEESDEGLQITEPAEQLLALIGPENTLFKKTWKTMPFRPKTSIAHTSLFTGSRLEPQMLQELKREILTADRIDLLVSFIRWSGIRSLMDELIAFTERGGELRIITTVYTGATELKSIEKLHELPGAKIKISYDTQNTRLHAKTYIFHRDTGFTTVYVGSSNISRSALTTGLEWNVKLTRQDLPETIENMKDIFDIYWHSDEFEYYDEGQRERLARALKWEPGLTRFDDYAGFDIKPYSYQQEILDRLQAERKLRGRYHNLIVAATGTGKTVISAFDYKQFLAENGPPSTLLFIAHREEILKKSLSTFRGVLKDPNFGELLVGKYSPGSSTHLFASIQSLNSRDFTAHIPSDYYDFIIVDEFHHAAAKTYRKILAHVRPKVLLGLTATPERMDEEDILSYFDHRVAAEIRLPEAIERNLLSPFQYFGVSDTVDLDGLRWSRGGYKVSDLEQVYTFDTALAQVRADHIVRMVDKYVSDPGTMKALGFCVSIRHAEFMADYFNSRGIPSIALTAKTDAQVREEAPRKLVQGGLSVIFVVDIYNEGVDIPEVDTVLFLRPTESLTIFLQQLGRGLRLSEGKDCLTVLDFIGAANKKYSFAEKFQALLTAQGSSIKKELENDFPNVPRGSLIQLEKKAKEVIYHNIRSSFENRSGLIEQLKILQAETALAVTLTNFLTYHHLSPAQFYQRSKGSFAKLCADAGILDNYSETLEEKMGKAFPRFARLDSLHWTNFLTDVLTSERRVFSEGEIRMLRMLQFTIWQKTTVDEAKDPYVAVEELKKNPLLLAELLELLAYNYDRVDLMEKTVELGFDCPLRIHSSYTRDQLLVALDFLKPRNMQEGVKHLPEKNMDVFLITLHKSSKDFTENTMYEDYSVNESLFHWQSQSTTTPESPTGQRYIHHRENDHRILLFVREYKNDPLTGEASPYTFLGLADYVSHTGSRPMSILWKLRTPIPAKYLKKTTQLLLG